MKLFLYVLLIICLILTGWIGVLWQQVADMSETVAWVERAKSPIGVFMHMCEACHAEQGETQ